MKIIECCNITKEPYYIRLDKLKELKPFLKELDNNLCQLRSIRIEYKSNVISLCHDNTSGLKNVIDKYVDKLTDSIKIAYSNSNKNQLYEKLLRKSIKYLKR